MCLCSPLACVFPLSAFPFVLLGLDTSGMRATVEMEYDGNRQQLCHNKAITCLDFASAEIFGSTEVKLQKNPENELDGDIRLLLG
jgi:hypothetical protein